MERLRCKQCADFLRQCARKHSVTRLERRKLQLENWRIITLPECLWDHLRAITCWDVFGEYERTILDTRSKILTWCLNKKALRMKDVLLIQLQTQHWTKILLLSLISLLCLTEHSILKIKIPVLITGFNTILIWDGYENLMVGAIGKPRNIGYFPLCQSD